MDTQGCCELVRRYQGTGSSTLPFQESLDFPGASQEHHRSALCTQIAEGSFGVGGGVVQGRSAAQTAAQPLCLPFCSSSGTEQVDVKRCSGLPDLHPSRVACRMLQANGLPEILEAIERPAQKKPFPPMAAGTGRAAPSSGCATLG